LLILSILFSVSGIKHFLQPVHRIPQPVRSAKQAGNSSHCFMLRNGRLFEPVGQVLTFDPPLRFAAGGMVHRCTDLFMLYSNTQFNPHLTGKYLIAELFPFGGLATSETDDARASQSLQHLPDQIHTDAGTRVLQVRHAERAGLAINGRFDQSGLFAARRLELADALFKLLARLREGEEQKIHRWPRIVFALVPVLGSLLQHFIVSLLALSRCHPDQIYFICENSPAFKRLHCRVETIVLERDVTL
jgi:hypothetical protein